MYSESFESADPETSAALKQMSIAVCKLARMSSKAVLDLLSSPSSEMTWSTKIKDSMLMTSAGLRAETPDSHIFLMPSNSRFSISSSRESVWFCGVFSVLFSFNCFSLQAANFLNVLDVTIGIPITFKISALSPGDFLKQNSICL